MCPVRINTPITTYPGYGAIWPFFYGGLGMTYESGSARGLVARRSDGAVVTYRNCRRHFVASMASCETAARKRQELLEMFYRYQVSALEEAARQPVREYILPRRGNTSVVDKLARLLVSKGCRWNRAREAFSNEGKSYPAGSYVVPLAQPEERLVRDLLEPDVPLDGAFLKSKEERRKRREPSGIYEATAWSLPLQYNVEAVAAGSVSRGSFEPVGENGGPVGEVTGGNATVAYLAPWGTSAAARLLTGLLREGVHVSSAGKSFTQQGRVYPEGTLIVMVKENFPRLHETVRRLAAATGAEVFAANSGWVDDRPILAAPV